MTGKPVSRWANAKEDAELDAKLKREKEEKKRRKQEKLAAKLEAERQQAAAANDHDNEDRPSKRRKLTPDPTTNSTTAKANGDDSGPPAKLLRFDRGGWGMARNVEEEYDKLNDIEEGTYGWVARATERRTGNIVALKRLKLDANDRGGLPVTGLREIQILKDCRHRNVVELKEVVIGDKLDKLDKYVPLASSICRRDFD